MATPGPVTMASPVPEKLALYVNLFRARRDAYAKRWENHRLGTAGWSPAVAGGWRKGMDRRTAAYLPLTAEVVAAHLVGDVFIGLYPLLTDNSCHFLAADFDGSTAMLDALAYRKAARASGVPAPRPTSRWVRGLSSHGLTWPGCRRTGRVAVRSRCFASVAVSSAVCS